MARKTYLRALLSRLTRPRSSTRAASAALTSALTAEPPPMGSVLANGLRTGQLAIEDERLVIALDASSAFLGDLAASIGEAVITLPAPGLAGWSGSDAFRERSKPWILEYVRKLRAAEAAIEKKKAGSGIHFGDASGGVDFGGDKLDVGFRKYQYGAIYVHPDKGPVEVHGAIYQKYLSLGAEEGFLGFPRTDELATTAETGRLNHFEHGSIYWSAATGAWSIHGDLRWKWWGIWAEMGYLGFPISDVEIDPDDGDGSVAYFQRGSLAINGHGAFFEYPHSVVFQDQREVDSVHCRSTFWMNAKGEWGFFGHLHNDDFMGCNVYVSVAPMFADGSNQAVMAQVARSLGGTLDYDDRNDDWDRIGTSDFIARNWDLLKSVPPYFGMRTSTTFLDWLPLAVPTVPFKAAVYLLGHASTGASRTCGPYYPPYRDSYGNESRQPSYLHGDAGQPCQ